MTVQPDDQAYELVPVDDLKPHPDNPRAGDVDAIQESIAANGFYGAVVAQRSTGYVLAGNHRLLAARAEGLNQLPVIWLNVDDDRARRILLVDNRSNDKAGYDDERLAALLGELRMTEQDLVGTGYSEADFLALVGDEQRTELPPVLDEDDAQPPPPVEPITQPGDIWLLGPHRLLCADCRDFDAVTRLLEGAHINVAFTSPPYASQRAYDESSGFQPIPPDEYVDWFADVQANVRAHLAEGGSWFVNIKEHAERGQRHLYVKDLTIAHVRRWGWRFVDELCWVDTRNGVPGTWPDRFKNAWEPVFHFSTGERFKFNPTANATESAGAFEYEQGHKRSGSGSRLLGTSAGREIGEGTALPSNVLHLATATLRGGGHSAPFPIALPAWFLRAYSDPGDVVFDPFMGAGSTILAAASEARVAFGTEISRGYCDLICRRYQKATGELPVLASTGDPHDFLEG